MFSQVIAKPVQVKLGLFSLHYRLEPLSVAMIMAAEGMTDRWLYNRLIRPVGMISALLKPFVAQRLFIECKAHIDASMPDKDPSGNAQEDLRAYAEFLPRLCYYYKWTTEQALALTLRDAVWFMQAGNYFETQNNELHIRLAGGKIAHPAELPLDSRFSQGKKQGKVDSERFAKLQLALFKGRKADVRE